MPTRSTPSARRLARLVAAVTLTTAAACHAPTPVPTPFDAADLWERITVAEAAGCDAIDYLHITHPPSGTTSVGLSARVVITTDRQRIEASTSVARTTAEFSEFLAVMLTTAGHRARAVTPSTVVVFLDRPDEALLDLVVEDDALALEFGRVALP
jgi:hypothetical protein